MDAVSIMQAIYLVSGADIPADLIDRGGGSFITSIYVDSINWYAGKSLHDPAERDYVTENPGTSDQSATGRWLSGAATTVFAGHLILARDEQEITQLRSLHMKLRRTWRNNEKARQVSAAITKLQLQRNELQAALSQLGRSR
jgi:hypothetical protein